MSPVPTPRFGHQEELAVLKVLRRDPPCLSGYYKNPLGGPSVQSFERALAAYHATKYAVCVSNGTTALHLGLLALGVKPGDEVITTPLTFSATATSILMCGATPVFADVDPDTWLLDPDSVRTRITEKTRVILPVHLLGVPCDMDELIRITEDAQWNIDLLEDNAQSLGARGWKGRLAGALCELSATSLQETKVITSGGEGGFLLTDSDALAERLRALRNHGQQYNDAPHLCFNHRMTEIQAAIGRVQLRKLDKFNLLQREAFDLLSRKLPKDYFVPQLSLPFTGPTHYLAGFTVANGFRREEYIATLTKLGLNRGIPGSSVGLGYTRTIMDLPLLLPYRSPCPVAEELVQRFLWFDCTRWRTRRDTLEIANTLRDVALEVMA